MFVALALHVIFWVHLLQCEDMSYNDLVYEVVFGALVTTLWVRLFTIGAASGDQPLASGRQSQED